PERAADDAVAAAVADVGLDEDAAQLGAHDGAGGAGFEAAGDPAVLADVGGELPGEEVGIVAAAADLRLRLHELDVPPGRGAERAGVVVREAAEEEVVRRHLVPLLAGHLARLAADAEGRVGQERGGRHDRASSRASVRGSALVPAALRR